MCLQRLQYDPSVDVRLKNTIFCEDSDQPFEQAPAGWNNGESLGQFTRRKAFTGLWRPFHE